MKATKRRETIHDSQPSWKAKLDYDRDVRARKPKRRPAKGKYRTTHLEAAK